MENTSEDPLFGNELILRLMTAKRDGKLKSLLLWNRFVYATDIFWFILQVSLFSLVVNIPLLVILIIISPGYIIAYLIRFAVGFITVCVIVNLPYMRRRLNDISVRNKALEIARLILINPDA